jgi:hypothetical protein
MTAFFAAESPALEDDPEKARVAYSASFVERFYIGQTIREDTLRVLRATRS